MHGRPTNSLSDFPMMDLANKTFTALFKADKTASVREDDNATEALNHLQDILRANKKKAGDDLNQTLRDLMGGGKDGLGWFEQMVQPSFKGKGLEGLASVGADLGVIAGKVINPFE